MIVVMGATGNIGRKVTEQLLAEGRKVRGIARGKEKLAALAAKGAEAMAGDASDPEFLKRAFAGAESILTMIPTNLQAADIKAYQDRIGDDIIQAIRESGAKYVVEISSMGGQTEQGNGIVAGLARQEKRTDSLPGVNVLHLRPGYFMENLLASVQMVKTMGILGSPIRPDAKVHLIATADIARYAAERLVKKDFTGKSVHEMLGSRDYTMAEAATILGRAIGKPDLPYVQFPYEDAAKAMAGMGMAPSVVEAFMDMNRGFNEGRVFSTRARTASNTTPTRLEDFAPVFAAEYKNG